MAIGGIAASLTTLRTLVGLDRHQTAATQSATIGDIRTIISAEEAYKSYAGHYDTLQCLAAPSRCIPNYSGDSPLGGPIGTNAPLLLSGHMRTFHPGPPADPPRAGEAFSPSRMKSYAYIAVPMPAYRQNVCAFCGDATGRICFTPDGSPPLTQNGLCVVTTGTPPSVWGLRLGMASKAAKSACYLLSADSWPLLLWRELSWSRRPVAARPARAACARPTIAVPVKNPIAPIDEIV